MEAEIRNLQDFTAFGQALKTKFTTDFKPLVVTVKAIKDEVSRSQQRYLYGIVYPAVRRALLDKGYEIQSLTDDQFDHFMRGMFYYDLVKTKKGDYKVPKRLSFGKGKKDEVRGYIDELIRMAAQLGCYIASPNDSWYVGAYQPVDALA